MSQEWWELLLKAIAKHPGPWEQWDGYNDRGGQYTSIRDAAGKDVFDGESGHLSDSIFNVLLNLPEMIKALRDPTPPAEEGRDG